MPPSALFFCNYCEVVGATATTSREGASPPALIQVTPYVVFTAFSITSDYKTNGTCKTSSSVIPLSLAHSIPKPTSIPASEFYRTANAFLIDWLGFTTCSNGEDAQKIAYPVPIPDSRLANQLASITQDATLRIKSNVIYNALGTRIPNRTFFTSSNKTPSASLNETPSASPSRTPSASHRLGRPAKIGLAVTMSFLALLFLAVFLKFWRHYRKRKSAESTKVKQNKTILEDNHQPFLQQKAELEAEHNVRHELEAEDRRYELAEGERIHEVTRGPCRVRPSHRLRQELRSEEHAKELANHRERDRDLSIFGQL
ncbi:MAG: hypothetical protein LQ351_004682 [Letrouitia transgressa]|nr:MAG: hypothetical protein LQ351_004682 [Letrouitia transgressa]